MPPGLYRSRGGYAYLIRPLLIGEVFEDHERGDLIAAGCDRCTVVDGVAATNVVVIQDKPLPIHHDQWGGGCQCGGSLRLPAGVYDTGPDGEMMFVRPLDDSDALPGSPTSYSFAYAARDPQAIAAALRLLGRADLSVDAAADAVEGIDPSLMWLATWLRQQRLTLTSRQTRVVLLVAAVALLLQTSGLLPPWGAGDLEEWVRRVGDEVVTDGPDLEQVEDSIERLLRDRRDGPDGREGGSGRVRDEDFARPGVDYGDSERPGE